MKFNYDVSIDKGDNIVWEKVQNPVKMMFCIPGVESVDEVEENEYKVVIFTKLGPVKLRFNGSGKVNIEEEKREMEASVSMSDNFSGNVYGKFTMGLEGNGEDATKLLINADVNIAGKLGEFAQPLIKRKADQVIKEFSQNLKNYIAEESEE